MDDCRQLASQIPQVPFCHCFKEANRCADGLARMGTQQSLDFILYDSPPMDSVIFADFDNSGLYHNRCCPEMIVKPLVFFNYVSFPPKKNKRIKLT